MKFHELVLAVAFNLPGAVLLAAPLLVTSPDGQVRFESEGTAPLKYTVRFKGQTVVESSALAFAVDGVNLAGTAAAEKVERSQVNETYPWRGVHAQAINRCNTARFAFPAANGQTGGALEARVFNDGVAFRWIALGSDKPQVPEEATTFVLPEGSTVWYHDLGGHYEAVHVRKEIGSVPAREWAAPPLTFKLPGGRGYGAITEAALVNYSGMALQADGQRGFKLALGHQHPISYPFRLRYSNDIERVSQPAAIAGPITTPWRVIMLGADLNALVNSDMVHNLCPPPDPQLFPKGLNTDWIKPGRAVWKYLDGGPSTLEGMKEFSRLAGQLGFEYHVIEGFWSRWSDEEIKELAEYSRQQGVGLWCWRHSNQLRTLEARTAFFKKLHDLGVVGAKIDFFDHEHKEVIDRYTALLAEAAKYQIMVNFHGANKPAGEPRTWPNELVREGIRGMESSRLKERARHDATLPFTRFLAGHADYTPVHFGARRGDTTWAHQIASAAVFTAPLLTYGAHPTNLLANPAVEMIKSIPAVWDETSVLPPSEIGELAVFARRHGPTWFLAILNGPNSKSLKVPLAFLGEGEYGASLVRDDPDNAAAVKLERATLKRGDTLAIELSAGGGFIGRFNRN